MDDSEGEEGERFILFLPAASCCYSFCTSLAPETLATPHYDDFVSYSRSIQRNVGQRQQRTAKARNVNTGQRFAREISLNFDQNHDSKCVIEEPQADAAQPSPLIRCIRQTIDIR